MTYTEVQDLCERRKVTILDISTRIGMSYTGFKNSMETGKMSASKVALLCKELRITPNTFFGWEKIDPVTYIDSNVQNGHHNTQNIEAVSILKQQLSVKDDQIRELLQLLKQK